MEYIKHILGLKTSKAFQKKLKRKKHEQAYKKYRKKLLGK